MLVQAAKKLGIDLAASVMVGDSERDVEAGRRAGCFTVLLDHGDPASTRADATARNLAEAVEAILARRGPIAER
jgi:D-glycero-D-manno-heptose 1,7-bisphosphate phosphatase